MSNGSRNADALVVFGITGDLARKMTLRSLYRLERRKLLDCPVFGVASGDWSAQRLEEHARRSIEEAGEKVNDRVFARFARRLDYVRGDVDDDATYERLVEALGKATFPAFYLEIPPRLFSTVIAGLSRHDLVSNGQRVVVEKPFGHDLASARALSADLHKYLDESQLYRIDHFLGKMGVAGDHLPAVREHDARAGLEPQLRRPRFRSRWPRRSVSRAEGASTTPSARCVTWSSTTSCR